MSYKSEEEIEWDRHQAERRELRNYALLQAAATIYASSNTNLAEEDIPSAVDYAVLLLAEIEKREL